MTPFWIFAKTLVADKMGIITLVHLKMIDLHDGLLLGSLLYIQEIVIPLFIRDTGGSIQNPVDRVRRSALV